MPRLRPALRSSNSKFRYEVEPGCFVSLTGSVLLQEGRRIRLEKPPLCAAATLVSPSILQRACHQLE